MIHFLMHDHRKGNKSMFQHRWTQREDMKQSVHVFIYCLYGCERTFVHTFVSLRTLSLMKTFCNVANQ